MKEKIKSILDEFNSNLNNIDNASKMQEMKVEYLGKKGKLTSLLKSLGEYDQEDRPYMGQLVNEAKTYIKDILDNIENTVVKKEKEAKLLEEKIDVTLPGKTKTFGSLHPVTKIFYELADIFIGIGFDIKDGPEIELDEYCFDKLNIPKDHPARDMQDTFYISPDIVLRPHTSPVQIRTMLKEQPPIRMLCPGRVYRSDDIDATHSPIFHQMEGLVVDKGVNMADLKGILDTLATEFFGKDIKTRLRPSYFPFTEPSAEVDFTCVNCMGKGCSVCKQTGWIEVLGCGMVHPTVLENCGIDSSVYSGLAFGIGLDRMANLKYKTNDIRLLYENDVRFLKQF